MANLQRIGGGAVGVGLPIAARRFLDESGQGRLTQPSVILGGGTGLAAGGLFLTDAVDVPVLTDDFLAAHALGSLPAAAFYAAFPKQRGSTTTEQVKQRLGLGNGAKNRRSGGSGGGSSSASAGTTEVVSGGRSGGSRRRAGSN